MTTTPNRSRDAFSFQETARILGISAKKLSGICQFFDADADDEWELIEGEFFEYEPGQARSRRFYEEGVMAIAKYLEEKEGGSILAKIYEFFTQHRARVTRTLVKRRIIQVTQDRSSIQIRGDLVFRVGDVRDGDVGLLLSFPFCHEVDRHGVRVDLDELDGALAHLRADVRPSSQRVLGFARRGRAEPKRQVRRVVRAYDDRARWWVTVHAQDLRRVYAELRRAFGGDALVADAPELVDDLDHR